MEIGDSGFLCDFFLKNLWNHGNVNDGCMGTKPTTISKRLHLICAVHTQLRQRIL